MVAVDPHPLLDARFVALTWPVPLGALPSPASLLALMAPGASQPLPAFDDTRVTEVRDLLRAGGFKPAGRNKPCNEYIRKVASNGTFPIINAAVDATNVAVLHGGLPVSTVDQDLLGPPLRVGVADAGQSYVFNRSGQTIDLSGLLCLFDAEGPCANAVKDSQRAKTTDETRRTLTVVWGTTAWPGRAEAVASWFRTLANGLGAT